MVLLYLFAFLFLTQRIGDIYRVLLKRNLCNVACKSWFVSWLLLRLAPRTCAFVCLSRHPLDTQPASQPLKSIWLALYHLKHAHNLQTARKTSLIIVDSGSPIINGNEEINNNSNNHDGSESSKEGWAERMERKEEWMNEHVWCALYSESK